MVDPIQATNTPATKTSQPAATPPAQADVAKFDAAMTPAAIEKLKTIDNPTLMYSMSADGPGTVAAATAPPDNPVIDLQAGTNYLNNLATELNTKVAPTESFADSISLMETEIENQNRLFKDLAPNLERTANAIARIKSGETVDGYTKADLNTLMNDAGTALYNFADGLNQSSIDMIDYSKSAAGALAQDAADLNALEALRRHSAMMSGIGLALSLPGLATGAIGTATAGTGLATATGFVGNMTDLAGMSKDAYGHNQNMENIKGMYADPTTEGDFTTFEDAKLLNQSMSYLQDVLQKGDIHIGPDGKAATYNAGDAFNNATRGFTNVRKAAATEMQALQTLYNMRHTDTVGITEGDNYARELTKLGYNVAADVDTNGLQRFQIWNSDDSSQLPSAGITHLRSGDDIHSAGDHRSHLDRVAHAVNDRSAADIYEMFKNPAGATQKATGGSYQLTTDGWDVRAEGDGGIYSESNQGVTFYDVQNPNGGWWSGPADPLMQGNAAPSNTEPKFTPYEKEIEMDWSWFVGDDYMSSGL